MSRGRGKRDVVEIPAPAVGQGRVPPHDLDAEAAVLSAVLLDTSSTSLDEVASLLRPEHFYSPANRRIWEAVLALAEQAQKPDAVTVAGWLKQHERLAEVGGVPYIARITDAAPSVENLPAYAEIVRDRARLRLLIGTCQKLAAEGYTASDGRAFVDDAERQVFEIAAEAIGTVPYAQAKDLIREVFSDIQAAADRGTMVTGLTTGFDALDDCTGGQQDGEVTVIGARPGMGKTAFAVAMALAVAAAVPHASDAYDRSSAAFFSLEMPAKQIALRAACSEAHVDIGKIRRAQLSNDDWARLTQAASWISSLDFFIDDTPAIALFDLRSKLRRIQAELSRRPTNPETGKPRRLGLVLVDYLQLMRAPGASSREEEIGTISRGLKQIAKELQVPIVALSQLNRGVETRVKDKRPTLSDLRESGAIEQDADVVLFLYRDEYYNKDSLAKGIAEVIVAKQRNGPTGKVPLSFTSSCTRFDNLEIGSAPPPGMFDD